MKRASLQPSLDQLGDRHFRATRSRHPISPRPGPSTVRLSISPGMAVTPEGQRCLGMIALLVARQFKLVHRLSLDVPALPVQSGTQVLGASDRLDSRIREVVLLASAGQIRVASATMELEAPVVEVVVGAGGISCGTAELTIGVAGADWKAYLGPVHRIPDVAATTNNPAGPFFAACLAAGEVFRFLAGLQSNHLNWMENPIHFSLWGLQGFDHWGELPDGSWDSETPLSPIYLVGAGAVGQAFLSCVIASDLPKSHFTLVDGDFVDGTNLNRYPLCTRFDVGKDKVKVAADCLHHAGHSVLPIVGHWDAFVSRLPHLDQPAALVPLEDAGKFELMLSCVDRNNARRGLQNAYPKALLGASTLDFRVQVATYSPLGEFECLKCHHPPEDPPVSLEMLAQQLIGKSPDELSALALERGVPLHDLLAFLQEPAKCGTILPSSLSPLAGAQPDEMSVGFVSVAAGVFLFRDTWMLDHGFQIHSAGNNGFYFGFAPLNWMEAARAKSPVCDCLSRGAGKFRERWGT